LHYLVKSTPWLVVQLMAQAGWMCVPLPSPFST
jgi:hypothetical protein